MREEIPNTIHTNKFDRDKYLKRNAYKCKRKAKDIRGFMEHIIYDQDKAVEETKELNKILIREGNVVISTLRYNFYKDYLIPHKIKEIIEYETSNDVVIVERI